ncbi:MAG TPA: ABC transporter substrate-binding protein [Chloroflexota bacterium]|nr:ABC transporter substrate-binding protein [Chloroflexota bacterium]
MFRRSTRPRALAAAGGLLLAAALAACASPAAPAPPPAATPAAAPPAAPAASAPGPPSAAPTSPAAPTAPPAPMRVTMASPSPGVIFLPYYLGQAKGLYAAEGVDADLSVLTANTAIAAILAGELDFTTAAGSGARAAAAGAPIRIVMGLIDQSMIDLHVAPDVGSVPDLKGKTIAITSIIGTPAQIGRRMVQAAGLNPDGDVDWLQTQTTPNAYTALTAGGVPAALIDPPLTAMAESQGFRAIARGRDYIRSTQGGLATSQQRIQEQPDKLARTLRGTLRSIAYTLDQEQDAVDYIVQNYDLDPDTARRTYRALADGIVRNGLTALDIIEGELRLAGETATGEDVVDYSALRQVLAEPAWRDICAPRNGQPPQGCR